MNPPTTPPRLRRCAHLFIEPRAELDFSLQALLQGGGLSETTHWRTWLLHAQREVELQVVQLSMLAQVPETPWSERAALDAALGAAAVEDLLALGLLVAEGSAEAARDEALRQSGWHGLSAALHLGGRWREVDAAAVARSGGFENVDALMEALGTPPPACPEVATCAPALELPKPTPAALDAALQARATCRNFDPAATIALPALAAMLWRALGAQAVVRMPPGMDMLKKNVPSAGALHPTEAYLLAQRVEGLDTGIYHYHAGSHQLRPMQRLAADELAALARLGLAGQTYFAAAPALLVLSCRFERNFWKYRNHSKAYRAALLDVGHVSMLLYGLAQTQGYGAFVTSAINDIPLEQQLGLDPVREGVIAVFGFGPRAGQLATLEFDPLQRVWPEAG